MRSFCGLLKNSCGVFCFDDLALVHEDHAVGHRLGKAHLVGHADHRHALVGQLDHHVEHLLDHLRVERRGRLVEQHDLGRQAQRARDRHALLLAAGELQRVLAAPARRCAPARAAASRAASASFLGILPTHIGASVRFSSTVRCGNRLNCWNTMPTCLRTLVDRLDVVGELDAVDDAAGPPGAPRAG